MSSTFNNAIGSKLTKDETVVVSFVLGSLYFQEVIPHLGLAYGAILLMSSGVSILGLVSSAGASGNSGNSSTSKRDFYEHLEDGMESEHRAMLPHAKSSSPSTSWGQVRISATAGTSFSTIDINCHDCITRPFGAPSQIRSKGLRSPFTLA